MAVTSNGYYGLALQNEDVWDGWYDPAHIFHKRERNWVPQHGRAKKYKGWQLFEYGLHPGAMVPMGAARAVLK